jgi:hypothetical protein
MPCVLLAAKVSEVIPGVLELAKAAAGHAHRFRDTFAVELLLAGVPLIEFPCFLAIAVSELRSVTTHLGRARDKNKLRLI